MADGSGSRFGGLVSLAGGQLNALVRQEIRLAKEELIGSAKRAGEGAALIGGAGLAGTMSLAFLSLAGWKGLGRVIGPAPSALVFAVLYGGGAVLLAQQGRDRLRRPGAERPNNPVRRLP
jgi:hypothetical protein